MSQQRRLRPSRAERARQKTRRPNLPREQSAAERRFEPTEARKQESAPPASSWPAPARPAPRPASGPTLDYSYVRSDLVRITAIFSLLLAFMVGLAFVIR